METTGVLWYRLAVAETGTHCRQRNLMDVFLPPRTILSSPVARIHLLKVATLPPSTTSPAHEMSDTQQQPQANHGLETERSSPSDTSPSPPQNPPNRPSTARSERQKACDHLARACWYLASDTGTIHPSGKPKTLYCVLWGFGFGVFDRDVFEPKIGRQRSTTTSAAVGVIPPTIPVANLPRPTTVPGAQANAPLGQPSSIQREVMMWLFRAEGAMQQAGDMAREARSLGAIIESWGLRQLRADLEWGLPSDGEDSSTSVSGRAPNGVNGAAHG
ncbi:hypothetical protein LTR95_018463 [Oleoguttula sp. CCFEE 5521]